MVIVGDWPDVVVLSRSVDVGTAVSVEMTVAVVEGVLSESVVKDADSMDSAVWVNVVAAIVVIVDISIESDVESVKTASDVDVRTSEVVDGSVELWVEDDDAESVVDCDSPRIVDVIASFVDVINFTVSVVDVEDKELVNESEVFAVVTDGNSDEVIIESVFVVVE